jgi:hypothetical protein
MVTGTKLILGMAVCALAGLAMPAHGETSAAHSNMLVASNEVEDSNRPMDSKVLLAAAGAETDANVARCDELTSGYEFRDILDARGYSLVALEDVDANSALAKCGAALDSYPEHLRTAFHYARAMEASSFLAFFPPQQDPAILGQATELYLALCDKNVALACQVAAGHKLRLGLFDEAEAILQPACKMDQSVGAGASCTLLGQMYEQGQIDQKKTLKAQWPFTLLDARGAMPKAAQWAHSLP